jgi:hypothetical protein
MLGPWGVIRNLPTLKFVDQLFQWCFHVVPSVHQPEAVGLPLKDKPPCELKVGIHINGRSNWGRPEVIKTLSLEVFE